jgi:phage terminase large subunit-like protein
VPLATAPDARDGARTTFEHFDETHRFTLPRLKQAHRTMLANLPKRLLADPWALETTTAYTPGESSVAEDTRTYARQVIEGAKADSRLFFFHRQASDAHNIDTPAGLRAAVEEAAGPTAPWRDIDGIVEQWQDPTADRPYLERVWLNRSVQASRQAFDVNRWRELAQPDAVIPEGELVTLGFDGARFHDATALVATAVESGLQSMVGLWEPTGKGEWETPEQEVDAAIAEAFERWSIWRLYADPYWFEGWLAAWSGRYGSDKVISWRTNRLQQMAYALKAFDTAIHSAEISHDGNEALTRHIGAACRRETQFRDDAGARLWVIEKERPDSPFKIDAAMAAVLSWRARLDALSAGATKPTPQWHGIYIPVKS